MSVQMQALGVKGDLMADVISPPEQGQPIPPQMQQAQQAMQQQLAQLHSYAQSLEGEVHKLTFEKQAKVVEHQYKMAELDKELEVKLAVAEITTKAQNVNERLSFVEDFVKQQQQHVHEAAMASQQNAHDAAIMAAEHGQAEDMTANQQAQQEPQPTEQGASA
jgi:hypothetical protein